MQRLNIVNKVEAGAKGESVLRTVLLEVMLSVYSNAVKRSKYPGSKCVSRRFVSTPAEAI